MGPPGSLASPTAKAHTSWGLVRLGGPGRLGQGHAAGAGGVESGVNAAVTGATLGEGVLLWLQGVQRVEPAVVTVAAGGVAGEGIAAGMAGVLRFTLKGSEVRHPDSREGTPPLLPPPLCVNPVRKQLQILSPKALAWSPWASDAPSLSSSVSTSIKWGVCDYISCLMGLLGGTNNTGQNQPV